MKTTIFTFHPHLNDSSHVNKILAKTAKDAGFEVRDMYSLYPDFKIDVKTEQKILEETDRIVLQFSIYWYQTPALLKQWFDDVLEYGWAYGATGDKLQNKEILLAISFGAGSADYTREGRFHANVEDILKPIYAIQYHTGLVFLQPFVTTGSLSISDELLKEQTEKYVEVLSAK